MRNSPVLGWKPLLNRVVMNQSAAESVSPAEESDGSGVEIVGCRLLVIQEEG